MIITLSLLNVINQGVVYLDAILNTKINILNLTRDVMALILIIWSLNPMLNFYNEFIQIIILIIWLLLAFFTDINSFKKSLLSKGFILSLVFPIYLVVGNIIGRNVIEIIFFLAPFIHFIFWYYYNQKNFKTMKIIVSGVVSYYIIIGLYSIYALSMNPFLARLLANGDQSITIEYAHPLLANFNYIYSTTLLLIAVIGIYTLSGQFKLSFRRKSILFSTIVIFFIVILQSQYAVALVLSSVFTFLMTFLAKKINYNRFLILLLISILSLLVLLNMQEIMYWLASLTNSRTLQIRFNDLGNILGGQSINSTQALSLRFPLYLDSINVFKSNPFLGMGKFNYRNGGIIGGHSELFDNLGYYGILGSGLLLLSIWTNYGYTKRLLPKEIRRVYSIVFLLFICHSILNLSYFQPFLIILYIVVPFFLLLNSQKYTDEFFLDKK